MKTVSIIRERGQLTIPDSIRQLISWVSPMSAVSITVIKPDEIIIRPHQAQVNWDKVWKGIKKARSIHSKGKMSALDFIQQDRLSH